jgi:putative inorganic carbon (HCO3(-)) transporter
LGTSWLEKSGLLSEITTRLPRLIGGLPGAVEGFHPNQVAGALLWVIPPAMTLSVGLWRQSELRRWGALAGLASAGMIGVCVLTQSRSAWFGLAVACLGIAAVVKPRARWALAAFSVVLIVAVVVVGIGSRATDVNAPGVVNATVGVLNWNFRFEIWRVALQGIMDFPFTGMGIGAFREVARYLYAPAISPGFDIAHAHNEFLQAALDLGLLGLAAFTALYVAAFSLLRAAWRVAAGSTSADVRLPFSAPTLRSLLLGLGGGLLAHLIYGLTDAVALGAKPGIIFWMLLGLIAGLYRQMQASRPAV